MSGRQPLPFFGYPHRVPDGDTIIRLRERIYSYYDNPGFLPTDPVLFPHKYRDPFDIECAALIASSLAYGRVGRILTSVASVLQVLDTIPGAVRGMDYRVLCDCFRNFRHRFTDGREIAALVCAVAAVTKKFGSLKACFLSFYTDSDKTVVPALCGFTDELRRLAPGPIATLVSCPGKGSACKRLHLFLRWMVRRDAVDIGLWREVPRSKLIVPLDTHMHRIGRMLGFTERKQADMKTALMITAGFGELCPEDPVRYDFSLTRMSMAGRV
ncbi:MAG: TIGR02757 family protein [Spirochaetales bacterium]|nr:TIGR02757 family protein [Spirochaetales bacterium]